MFDPMIGRSVEIRSTGGITYCGVIRTIRNREAGEFFELTSPHNADYQRIVHVVDRSAQIRML